MIVNRISRAMGERRLTISEVARTSGLAYSTVLDLYHDRAKRLDVSTLNALCQAIGVQSVAELFEYVPEENMTDGGRGGDPLMCTCGHSKAEHYRSECAAMLAGAWKWCPCKSYTAAQPKRTRRAHPQPPGATGAEQGASDD